MAIGLVFFYGPTICRSVLKMKFFGLVPVACYVIFSYQNDKIRELTSSTIQIIALNLFHSGILFFFVVPVCCFYLDELMRFTKRKYPFQVFILSIFFLFLFPISDWNKLFELNVFSISGALFVLSFNFLSSHVIQTFKELSPWKEEFKKSLLDNYPPKRMDDFYSPKIYFFVAALGVTVVQFVW